MASLTVFRNRGVASPPRRVVGLAALLILGILGMHALAQHCAVSAAEPGAAMTAATSSTLSVATSFSAHAHSMTHEPSSAALPASDRGEDKPASAMMVLCAVMLLTAAMALVLLLGFRRGWPRGWQVKRELSSLAIHVSEPLGNGPPYVVSFAVIRC